MEKFLFSYAWEILDLGDANGVTYSFACDMFGENLLTYKSGQPVTYAGANVDYEKVAPEYVALGKARQDQARIDLKAAFKEKYGDVTSARRNNDKLAFYIALLSYDKDPVPNPEYLTFKHAWEIWDYAAKNCVALDVAKDAVMGGVVEWGNLSEEKKAAENEWFATKVVYYDKGLEGAYLTGNRDLFEAVLASR